MVASGSLGLGWHRGLIPCESGSSWWKWASGRSWSSSPEYQHLVRQATLSKKGRGGHETTKMKMKRRRRKNLSLKNTSELLLKLVLGAHGGVNQDLESLKEILVLSKVEPVVFHPVLNRVHDSETNRESPSLILRFQGLPSSGNQWEELIRHHERAICQQESLQVLKIYRIKIIIIRILIRIAPASSDNWNLTEVGAIGSESFNKLLLGSSLEVAWAILVGDKHNESRLLIRLVLFPPFLLKMLKLVCLKWKRKKSAVWNTRKRRKEGKKERRKILPLRSWLLGDGHLGLAEVLQFVEQEFARAFGLCSERKKKKKK
jgi:hypothetical protein